MGALAVDDMLLVIAALILGIVVFAYVSEVLIPQETFAIGQQQASSIASSSSISVGPLLVNSSGVGSAVIEFYNPSLSGNVSIFVFPAPQYLEPSVGIIGPTSTPKFRVYLPNGAQAKTLTINQLYDLSGHQMADNLTVYTVPVNTPVTVVVNGTNSSDILVVWALYEANGYWFRIGYAFTGVPTT
ncbi:MAG: hypothetical protein RQ863_06960 [Sulfolobales archaeon]|nr:hypothetical protein [Sulfolobales archaeon]